MNPSSILLTGAGGFLGSILSKKLENNGFHLIGLDRQRQEINADISSPFVFEEKHYFNTVVHAAGKAHVVPRTPEEESEFYRVNLEGTKNLCAAIDQLPGKPEAFIFISTVAVYGKDSGEMIHEDTPLQGSTPYAKSKILAEEWLRDWAAKNNVTLSILRLPLVAGPQPPGNLGAMINGINTGRYASIGTATSRKSIVWAEDIAGIVPQLAKAGGIYNLTDGYHPSFGELEQAIAGVLGKKSPFKVPMIAAKGLGWVGDLLGSRFPVNSDKIQKITSTLTFDDQKARTFLGWNPTRVLDRVGEMVR
ncbi:MAG: NAD-dependent epimerase/dehydratase family protein [Lunatimonas sp.]|uniref:NAD-dependent epimerase/dehydratase family protein n=1 Tax=Lunatimonas sp. TaxID=2060141 RepID=UPI00263AC7C4|nr:NAD-dependent epimerase/dehydratase family protein [Lunatimonas sp.]MCC5936782.1 NAD-dependent epimerase/dehydratase family protein [Lunatimonas sp.]